MMEGVSNEAASLAGHQGLSNLCWIYDNNHITIDGRTDLTFTDDVPLRFDGLRLERHDGSHDANDLELRGRARSRPSAQRPTGRR